MATIIKTTGWWSVSCHGSSDCPLITARELAIVVSYLLCSSSVEKILSISSPTPRNVIAKIQNEKLIFADRRSHKEHPVAITGAMDRAWQLQNILRISFSAL